MQNTKDRRQSESPLQDFAPILALLFPSLFADHPPSNSSANVAPHTERNMLDIRNKLNPSNVPAKSVSRGFTLKVCVWE